MRQARRATPALDAAGHGTRHHQNDDDRRKTPADAGSTAADCAGDDGHDSAGENSPIYHELDPVIVAAEPPLQSSYHDYQSIVDVRRELIQLRASGSANSFNHLVATTTTTTTISTPCGVPLLPSCCDGRATNDTSAAAAGSCKWTLFSRLRLPRRTAATSTAHQHQGALAVFTSGRAAVTSPPDSATSGSTSPSCHATSWRGENFTGVTRADYFYVSPDDVRCHLSSIPAGVL